MKLIQAKTKARLRTLVRASLPHNTRVVELRGDRAWLNPVPNYDRSKGDK